MFYRKLCLGVALIHLICASASAATEDIYLKCSSRTFGDTVWNNNVTFVKIYPQKDTALVQDTGETTTSWLNTKITKATPEQFWLSPCRDLGCSTDETGVYLIDRVTGMMTTITKIDGSWISMATWSCEKANAF